MYFLGTDGVTGRREGECAKYRIIEGTYIYRRLQR